MFGPITTLAALLVLPPSYAEAPVVTDSVKIAAAGSVERAPALRASLANLDYSGVEVSSTQPPSAVQNSSSKPKRSMSSKVAGGVLGAVAGFFAGRYLGQAITLYGHIIGGPVGAVAGGILGAKF